MTYRCRLADTRKKSVIWRQSFGRKHCWLYIWQFGEESKPFQNGMCGGLFRSSGSSSSRHISIIKCSFRTSLCLMDLWHRADGKICPRKDPGLRDSAMGKTLPPWKKNQNQSESPLELFQRRPHLLPPSTPELQIVLCSFHQQKLGIYVRMAETPQICDCSFQATDL